MDSVDLWRGKWLWPYNPRPGKAITRISLEDYRAQVLCRRQVVGNMLGLEGGCVGSRVGRGYPCFMALKVVVAEEGYVVLCYRRPGSIFCIAACSESPFLLFLL